MERTTDYARCPVHNILLQPNYYLGINVWHCAKCDVYYAELLNRSIMSNITIGSKPIIFKQNLVKISEEEQEKQCEKQRKRAEERRFAEQYQCLPDASELLFCPIHRKMLQAKEVTLNFESGKVIAPIGYCNQCDTIYMNSLKTALLGNTCFLGRRVTWIPIKLSSAIKRGEWVQPNIKLEIKTNSMEIVPTKQGINIPKMFIASAVAQVALKEDVCIDIQGYYVASERQVYTTPAFLFSQILSEEMWQLHISDPKNIIKKYKQTALYKSQQKAIKQQRAKAAQAQKEKLQIEEKTLEQIVYTLPLLKEDDQHCPFCGHVLQVRYLKTVIYQEKVANRIRRAPCLFCKHCKVPFISLSQEIDTLNAIRPRMIYVFDARSCSNAQELLQRATQKYKKRPDSINNRERLPLEEELEEGKPLPNLSFDLETSKILVYANNCHCAACKKKYQQNTIRNRAALVKTIDGKTVKVNVEFCAGCGRYFMNITSFQQYCKRYGTILMECMMEHSLIAHNETWFYFAPDTILSRCGYSVKQGIPRTHRQAVLSYILDSGKANKCEVLEIISKFIRMRKNYQPGACERWREDIEFVNQYKIQSQEIVEGLTFQQKGQYRP